MNVEKIGKFEAICLVLIIIVNEIVLNIPNLIIYSTASSAILNVIFILQLNSCLKVAESFYFQVISKQEGTFLVVLNLE